MYDPHDFGTAINMFNKYMSSSQVKNAAIPAEGWVTLVKI